MAPSFPSNNLNQYTTIDNPTASPNYDDDGNTLSVGDGWVYEYNGSNRMVKATNGTTVMDFGYDYAGREISRKKTEDGTVTSHIRYVWNGMNKIEELNALDSNAILKKYVWGLDILKSLKNAGGVSALLAQVDGTGTAYSTFDVNGNVSEYLDGTGVTQGHFEYSPFGKVTVTTGARPDDFSYKFSTKEVEPNTGLMLYQMRPYNPITGRWYSRDMAGERFGGNLYDMIYNSPVNGFDDLGNAPQVDPGSSWYKPWTWYDANPEGTILTDPPPSGPLGTYAGVEVGVGLVGGYTIVECCDENHCKKRMKFLKYCIGITAGGGITFGKVNLRGTSCNKSCYEGWFSEGSAGPTIISVNGDIGLDSNSYYLPTTTPSGTFEGGVTVGFSALPVSHKMCYYQFMPDEEIMKECCK